MMWFGQHSLSPHSRGSSVAALVHINSIIVENLSSRCCRREDMVKEIAHESLSFIAGGKQLCQ
jgi:hypothetical protein